MRLKRLCLECRGSAWPWPSLNQISPALHCRSSATRATDHSFASQPRQQHHQPHRSGYGHAVTIIHRPHHKELEFNLAFSPPAHCTVTRWVWGLITRPERSPSPLRIIQSRSARELEACLWELLQMLMVGRYLQSTASLQQRQHLHRANVIQTRKLYMTYSTPRLVSPLY